jgi:hypothetical protein
MQLEQCSGFHIETLPWRLGHRSVGAVQFLKSFLRLMLFVSAASDRRRT